MNQVIADIIDKYEDDIIDAARNIEDIEQYGAKYEVELLLTKMLTDMHMASIDNTLDHLFSK